MNAKPMHTRSRIALILALIIVFWAFWFVEEGRAEVISENAESAGSHESVQDTSKHVPLDLKIFVHRNGLLVNSQGDPHQGPVDASPQRVGT
ncbi:MAG: hypothetical protein H2060_06935 [Azoarcus sp.]|nr:hypothetical protein [Azoarcus sp.]